MSKNAEVSIRLSVKDADTVKRGLERMGKQGAAALRKLETASKSTNKGLLAVDRAASEAKSGLAGLAQNAGPLGRIMSGLGPAGIAAGIGLAAIVGGAAKALQIAKRATDAFAETARAADDLGLSTEAFQALNFFAVSEGIDNQAESLRMLKIRASEAALGKGEMIEKLRALDPELLKNIQQAKNFDEQLRLIVKALRDTKSATEFTILANSAFGDSGLRLAKALVAVEGGFEGIIKTAREAGVVIDEHTLRRSAELKAELESLSVVIETNMNSAFVDLAGAANIGASALARFALGTKLIMDLFKDTPNKSSASLEGLLWQQTAALTKMETRRLEFLRKRKADWRKSNAEDLRSGQFVNSAGQIEFSAELQITENQIDRLQTKLDDIKTEISNRQQTPAPNPENAGIDVGETARLQSLVDAARANAITKVEQLTTALADLDAARAAGIIKTDEELVKLKASAKARLADKSSVIALAKARSEQNRAERQAAQIRAELGDVSQLVALREKELQDLAKKTGLTVDEVSRALQNYQDKLDGTARLQEQYRSIVEAALSPVQRLKAQISELTKNYDLGKISLDLYVQTLAILSASLDKATKNVRENSKAFKDAETIRKALSEAKNKALPIEQKLANEQARVNDLIKQGELNAKDAAAWMEIYGQRLRATSQDARLLANAQRVMDGVISGQINSFDDLAKAFGRALNQMIFDAIRANQKIAGSQGLGGFIQNIFSTFLGFLGISGATPTVPAGGSAPASGGFVGAPASAPEIAKVPKTAGSASVIGTINKIVSPAFTSAAPVQSPTAFTVSIQNNTDTTASAQTRQRGDGTRELLIELSKNTAADIGSGKFDGAMNQRFGLSPRAGAR